MHSGYKKYWQIIVFIVAFRSIYIIVLLQISYHLESTLIWLQKFDPQYENEI